ncbi:hypothetical protein Agabi119p4_10339 [Agaricus bisporus var. burnettii]|uniref:Protein N-terminal and lysine N-methyltransferase EFM7 n=1 Tax=Agaricus bisporus var. burnettii TaxID=192524 RepID=A0A8H7EWV7_AGABI|nr:hypothetical protein Agabi119p4_10339 [Agaricus bisporus var. burnettii]
MTSEDDASLDLDAMFPEPDRPPTPPPTFSTYTRHISGSDLKDIRIRLVGSHPLWAHHLWNASRSFAAFLDQTRFCENRTTLELGAGGALPSIIAALTGSTTTVITDYPDQPLLANILYNVSQNVPHRNDRVFVTGYIWGQNTTPLLKLLSEGSDGFDTLVNRFYLLRLALQYSSFIHITDRISLIVIWNFSIKLGEEVGVRTKLWRKHIHLCFQTTQETKLYDQRYMDGN